LYASEFNDTPILCHSHAAKDYLMDRANDLKLNIPEPIVISDIVNNKLRGNKMMDKDLLVDEAPYVLQSLLHCLGMRGEVKAITLTER